MLFDNLDDYETAIDTRAWLAELDAHDWRDQQELLMPHTPPVRTVEHMQAMRDGYMRVSAARRSAIAAHAGRARRKIASVPCPHCGGTSASNGRERRKCTQCSKTFAQISA